MKLSRALKRLESDLERVNSEVSKLADGAEECVKRMNELKVDLYAKFGTAINLDE